MELEQQTYQLLKLARNGDDGAREKLIKKENIFIEKIAARFCQRILNWQNDDELSIALMAFNEAIDTFNPAYSSSFLSYAQMVIHRRLVDFFRKEKKYQHSSIENYYSLNESWDRYYEEIETLERMEEIKRYEEELRSWSISLVELEKICPKHSDTRRDLVRVARLLASSPELVDKLMKYRKLPLKELTEHSGISRKSIKKGRKYIIALALLLIKEDFPSLRAYFQLTKVAKETLE